MRPEGIERPARPWDAIGEFATAVATYAGPAGAWTAALVAVSALLDGAGLLLLVPLLGLLAGGGGWLQQLTASLFAALGLSDRPAKLAVLLAVFLSVAAVRAFVNWRRDVALALLQTGFAQAERNRLIRSLATAPWQRLVGLRHADTTALISGESQRIASACGYLIQISVQLALILAQALAALLLAPALAAVGLAAIIGATGLFAAQQKRIRGLGEGVVAANQAMAANASALLAGLKAAVAQDAQHAFVAEFEATQSKLRGHQVTFAARQARGGMIYSIGSAIVAVTLVGIGTLLFSEPTAVLLTLILIFARMGPPAQRLYQSAQTLMFTLPAFEAGRRTERALKSPAIAARTQNVVVPQGAIRLSDATYVHTGGGGIHNVDLVIEPGQFVGIAGSSGAGKTTLADLIVGLLEPQSGSVVIGDSTLAGPLRRSWAGCVAYVTQDGFLFHETLHRNLTWASAAATEADIAEALELVGATDIVARLPRGLETQIGERGAIFSGGERQRLLVAGALLRRPRLLVLDEAANAIDPQSEAMLLARLKAMDRRPSILMISHREESLSHCESIIRVESGYAHIER